MDPVRAHHIGSLLRPAPLRDAYRRYRAGTLDEAGFIRAQDEAIAAAVAMQESLGLRLVTDGEFRRASYWAHFVDAVDGLEVREAVFEFTDADGDRMAFSAPHVAGKLARGRPISGRELSFLQQVATATPKITLPAPSTMHFWRGPAGRDHSVYPTVEELYDDLGAVYRAEIAALAAAGATFLQVDEVALAMLCDPDVGKAAEARGDDPAGLVGLYVDAINDALRGRPGGVTLGLHLCRGNYKGHWLAAGGYEAVAEAVFGGIDVDVLLLEFDSGRAGGFAPLRFVPETTRVVLGLVSSKTPVLEAKDDLRRAVEAASRYIPLQRLALSPQCGFASTVAGNPLTEDDQRRKLALVVEVAHDIWGHA
jgi:5-methyltetrahydropteroyltriglutamate--homocysteine methyltransferase